MDTESINCCTVCGINLGECNPRQYCMKTYCPMEFEVGQPEVVDLTQTEIIDLTQPEVIDLTQPEVVDLTK